MGIFKDFFDLRKKNKAEMDGKKFEELSLEEQAKECDRILAFKDYKEFKKNLAKKPYLLPYIMSDLDLDYQKMLEVIYIGTKDTDFDLDKLLEVANNKISKKDIIEVALKNKPEYAIEKYNRPEILNYLGSDAIIDMFAKYPAVINADCDALKTKGKDITLFGKGKNDKVITRKSTLLAQLKRALNLYFRPEAKQDNGFDDFALTIVNKIEDKPFLESVFSENMIKYIPTAANEMLKKNPEKARIVPGKTFHLWNNRTFYVVPNEVRKKLKSARVKYAKARELQLGELKNASLKSFTEAEKINLVKKCVKNVPENYFDICKMENYSETKNNGAVQLYTYVAFKKQGKQDEITALFKMVGSKSEKKILAREKANATRKANKRAKAKAEKEATKELELK